MSTRAVYTFIESGNLEHHVYKHSDGYPTGAAGALVAALDLAWPLPRYEGDEFAAAFVAANKTQGGGIRLLPSGKFEDVAPGDVAYHYVIAPKVTSKGAQLLVTAYEVYNDLGTNAWTRRKLFTAPLKSGDTLIAKAAEWQAKQDAKYAA